MISSLPVELILEILKFAGDFNLAVKMESIFLGLPHRYSDPCDAYLDLILEQFPISASLTQSSTWVLERTPRKHKRPKTPITLCQVAWIVQFRPHILIWDDGELWRQIASQNSSRMLVILHRAKVNEGFPLELLDSAVEHGNFEAFEYFWNNDERDCAKWATEKAAENGQLEMLRYLKDSKRIELGRYCLSAAASRGHLELVQYLSTFMEITYQCITAAADYGHLSVLEFLFAKVPRSNPFSSDVIERAMKYAASRGHLEVVKFLVEKSTGSQFTEAAMRDAIKEGKVEVFRYLYDLSTRPRLFSGLGIGVKSSWPEDILGAALIFGDISVLKVLHSPNTIYPERSVREAISKGHVDVLRFLLKQAPSQISSDRRIMDKALLSGNTEIVQLLLDHGISGDIHLDSIDVLDLKVIKLLHDRQRLVWGSARAMDKAAKAGLLDVVQFLHAHYKEGCTFSAMDMAAANGHLHVVKWLHENRTEGCSEKAMDNASAANHFDVVKFLHENRTEGCTTRAWNMAARHADMRILKFLHTHRSEGCTTEAMDIAAELGHLNTVRFLHKNRTGGCTDKSMAKSVDRGNMEVIKFLLEAYPKKFRSQRWCVSRAFRDGRIDVVRFMMEEGLADLDSSSMREFATKGFLREVHWMKENGFVVTENNIVNLERYHPRSAIERMLQIQIKPPIDPKTDSRGSSLGSLNLRDWVGSFFMSATK
ncbi:hypothetical protein HDU97_000173 [Phlyctochytrium planicorne]|nr:hypothetical protein HDU97_000173 [Phlyctochytrium planicorne]